MIITHRESDGKHKHTKQTELFQISQDITLQTGFCQRVDPVGCSLEGWWFQN